MMTRISIVEFEADVDHFVDEAEAGATFVITRDGEAVTMLRAPADFDLVADS